MQFFRFLLPLLLVIPQVRQPSYEDEIMQWRRDRETELKKAGGWLDVAGLYWLKPGVNTVGTDAACQLVLPAGKAPARVGKFIYENGSVAFEPERGLDATINGMGRGAGNCPLELLLGFLKNPKFQLRPVLQCIRDVFLPLERKGVPGFRAGLRLALDPQTGQSAASGDPAQRR